MKYLACLLAGLLCVVYAHGQNDSNTHYEVETTHEKLKEIQKGTNLSFAVDQLNSDPGSIGFSFPYHGTSYTIFYITPNGSLHFGEPAGGTAGPLAPVRDAYPGKIEYLLEGNAPNRTLTIEWEQIKLKEASGTSDLFAQVRLFEHSGNIEFVYGFAARKIDSPTQSIGTTLNGIGPEGDIRLSTVYTKSDIVVSYQYLNLSEVITLSKKSLVVRFRPAKTDDEHEEISDES